MRSALGHSARRILPLAWPVFVGQLAVLAFSTVDTVLMARYAALDLAALSIGSSAYITVFIGLMGIVLAIGPIAGQLFGAGRPTDAGHQLHQAVWLCFALSVPGCALLLLPEPFLALSHADPDVAAKVRSYLGHLAFALPPALLFTAFRGFNTAVSRPKIVMALQLGALALKLPLSTALAFGISLGPLSLPALGAGGCGLATAIIMWLLAGAAWWVIRRDSFYGPFGLQRVRLARPHMPSLSGLLRLGVPMALSVLIEVTGFAFMSLFVARMGTGSVAGHQLAINLVTLMFMVPLALGNAAATLVAQRIGAGDPEDAGRLGRHGMQIAVLLAGVLGNVVYFGRETVLGFYTADAVIIAAALPLLAWVALFHMADAVQTVASFLLRAYRITVVPLLIYAVAIWGVGLAGGYLLGFDTLGGTPLALQGARGFWVASTAGLVLAAVGLVSLWLWVLREKARDQVVSKSAA